MVSNDKSICQNCGSKLKRYDKVSRIVRTKGGKTSWIDLYDLANVSNDNYAANKYGWTDIAGCRAVRVRDGYILKLPKPTPL